MKETTSTDNRKFNGAQSKGDKRKIPVTIYRPGTEVKQLGGIAAARKVIGDAFDNAIIDSLLTDINKL